MALVNKIISSARTYLFGPSATKGVTDSIKAKNLLKYKGIETAIGEYGTPGISKYRVKPDITMPVNLNTKHLQNPAFELKHNLLKANNPFQTAELGNLSMRLSQSYERALPEAEKEIKAIFDGFDVSIRTKGANSVYSKLKRVIEKKKLSIKTDEQARQIVQDAIGGRIQLPNLKSKDIIDTLEHIKIDGQGLSNREKRLVMKLFANEPLSAKEMSIAQKYAKPVKLALAERQSEPVFKKFILSGLKDALDRKVTTFEQLEKAGVRKDLIAELKSNPNIKAGKITEVNNYKGTDGVAYFSDKQIREFEKLQLATGERFDIITCSENIDLAKYGLEGLSKNAKDAIKSSGYTTAQVNMTLKDGSFAEIQVRGSGMFGEYEHFKYDSILDKNTLGKILEPYSNAVKSLNKNQMKDYDAYISKTYDYYRLRELNIHVPKPKLPEGLDPILSEESMQKFYKLNKVDQAEKMRTFIPHVENTVNRTFVV